MLSGFSIFVIYCIVNDTLLSEDIVNDTLLSEDIVLEISLVPSTLNLLRMRLY